MGLKLRVSHLLGRLSTTVTPPALFALVVLEIGSCFQARPAWTMTFFFTSCFSYRRCALPLPEIPPPPWDGGVSQFSFSPFPYHLTPLAHGLAWNLNPPDLSLPCSWDGRLTPLWPAIDWNGGYWIFCLNRPRATISVFQVARIIGMAFGCNLSICFTTPNKNDYASP
jgi:hypothetical protein